MAFSRCDATCPSLRHTCCRTVARHKDEKSFRAVANTESQASKEESHTDSCHPVGEKEESFVDPVSDCYSEEQIKTKTAEHNFDARPRRESLPHSSRNDNAFAASTSCFRKKSVAERESFTRGNSGIR